MTNLPSKAVRDALNIDRHDRAFCWAALAMRSGILLEPRAESLIPSIKVAQNLYQGGEFRVALEVRLPYDSVLFLRDGGDFGLAIGQFLSGDFVQPTKAFMTSTKPDIVAEPSWVNTLEKYVYWLAIKLLEKGAYKGKDIDIKINEENYPNTYIAISASFKIDPALYFGGSPIVDSFFWTNPRG